MITKQSRALSLLTLTLAGAWAGCDPQADPSYVGESLLSIQGSIKTASDSALSSDIVPAIAWTIAIEKGDFERVRVQETEVRGEFPNSFEMNLISPPPADALRLKSVKGFESEPAVYNGYIIALPAKHDHEIVLGYERSPADTTCTGEGDAQVCELKYCDYYDQCFTERCQGDIADIGGGECTVIDGKPEVRAGLGMAAGFVRDYALIYLDRPAKRGSVTAFMWDVEELAAGYHLVDYSRVDELEEGFTEADWECWDAAELEAEAAFETAYGMSSDELNDDNPLSDALWVYQSAAFMEHGCKPQALARIVDDATGLVMTLGGLGEE